MSRLFILFTFLVISSLGIHFEVFAGSCTICREESGNTIHCPVGHKIHSECLSAQVKNTDVIDEAQARRIQNRGLPCYGADGHCDKKIPFSDVQKFLEGTQELRDFNTRLGRASSPSSHSQVLPVVPTQVLPQAVKDPHAEKVQKFRNQLQEAFNLCCPNSSCAGILGSIEGCNAAICESCGTKFCYLCLKPEIDSTANHVHTRAHSGDYWENRDAHTGLVPARGQSYQEVEEYSTVESHPQLGKRNVIVRKPYKYTARYHWLIVRQKLEALFQKEEDPTVKEQALDSLIPLLKKNKMWPLPLAQEFETWAQQGGADSSLDAKNWIALLQNEGVFQVNLSKHTPDETAKSTALARVEFVKAELKKLNAPFLSSLDVRAAHSGQPPHNPPPQNQNITPVIVGHADQRIANLAAQLQRDARDFFAPGGNEGRIYLITDPRGEVAPFVLGDELPGYTGLNYKEVVGWRDWRHFGVRHPGYCESRGASVPTKGHLEALVRAMSPNDGEYDREAIGGKIYMSLWSSSVNPENHGEVFLLYVHDARGFYTSHPDYFYNGLRCIKMVDY